MGGRRLDRWLLGVAAPVLIAFGARTSARAQALDWNTSFDPGAITAFPTPAATAAVGDENVTVRQRPHPEYQPAGIQTGGFILYPSVTASSAYDDNIFAVQTGARADLIETVSPEIDVQSTWSRDQLWAFAKVSEDLYASHSSEDATQAVAGIGGKLELGDANLIAGAKVGQYVLPRAWDNVGLISERPLLYDFSGFFAGASETFNHLTLSARAEDQIYKYHNGETSDGQLVFEQGQNRNVAIFSGRAEYAVSPDTSLYISGAFNLKSYALSPPAIPEPLNSQGYRVVVGADLNLTRLIRGELQIGYQDQRYASPLFRPIRGLSAYGQIEWLVTPLTTVSLSGARAIGDAGIINSAGFLTTAGGVQVDHELLRNLILTAKFSAARDQYQGISRTDDRLGAGFSADWRLSRRLAVSLGYTYTDQRSQGAERGSSFKDNRISITVGLHF